MATIAAFRLPTNALALGATIDTDSGIRLDLERIVPAQEGVLPFFWVSGCSDFERFERVALEVPAVRSLEVASEANGRRLYRARWSEDVEGVVRGITTTGGTILSGRGTADGWRIELRFLDHGDVRTFQQYCTDRELSIDLERLYTVTDEDADEHYGLTADQRETIRRAYERGYFEEPQVITQADLATEFDVSQRAISRRLQRGLSRLVGSTVGADVDPG
ncbi:helix-turn-helix domain-containing protein [Natrialbaceae archaeon A-gly3]